jgi:hypothetical protein
MIGDGRLSCAFGEPDRTPEPGTSRYAATERTRASPHPNEPDGRGRAYEADPRERTQATAGSERTQPRGVRTNPSGAAVLTRKSESEQTRATFPAPTISESSALKIRTNRSPAG